MAKVCPYGVSSTTFRSIEMPVEHMVLSAGRLVPAKQHHLVIEAVGAIDITRRPRVIVATPENSDCREDPSYVSWLSRVAHEKGVSMEIRNNPSEEELVALYNRAMAVVFVSIMEPFGLVALEAMACGTPVIGVREGGIRESVLDGLTGLLVERDPREIASAIDYLCQNPKVREQLGQQASQCVRSQWTWERSIDRYEEEVKRLLAEETG